MTPQPPQDRDWQDLLGPGPDRGAAEVLEETKALLGIGIPRIRYRPSDPDMSDLAEGLGLK